MASLEALEPVPQAVESLNDILQTLGDFFAPIVMQLVVGNEVMLGVLIKMEPIHGYGAD